MTRRAAEDLPVLTQRQLNRALLARQGLHRRNVHDRPATRRQHERDRDTVSVPCTF